MKKNIGKLYLCKNVAPNSSDLRPFDNVCSILHQRVYWTPFKNVSELKKRMVQV